MPKEPENNERLKRACALYVQRAIKKPEQGYTFENAMVEAGYSKSYARKSAHLVRANIGTQAIIDAEKAKIEARALWDVERIEQEFISQYAKADKANDATNALRALENVCKMHGGFTENQPNPQRVFELSEQQAAFLDEFTRWSTAEAAKRQGKIIPFEQEKAG